MMAEGPKYLTHPSSLGAKMLRRENTLQEVVKMMEDPERAEAAREGQNCRRYWTSATRK
jgi:hypothetical protein